MTGYLVGILGFQGDLEEHLSATKLAMQRSKREGKTVLVKDPETARSIDGLIVPGGESTVIGRMAAYRKVLEVVREKAEDRMPILATCAGLITVAKKTYDRVVGETNQPLLGLLDIVVERNAFGRQHESFEADLDIPTLGDEPFRGVFIRSPTIREAAKDTTVLARLDEHIVGVQKNSIIGTSFHPELTSDTRLHEYFLKLVG